MTTEVSLASRLSWARKALCVLLAIVLVATLCPLPSLAPQALAADTEELSTTGGVPTFDPALHGLEDEEERPLEITGALSLDPRSGVAVNSTYVILSSNEDGSRNVEVISDPTESGLVVTVAGTDVELPRGSLLCVTEQPVLLEMAASFLDDQGLGMDISSCLGLQLELTDAEGNPLTSDTPLQVTVENYSYPKNGFVYDALSGQLTAGYDNETLYLDLAPAMMTGEYGRNLEVVIAAEKSDVEVTFLVEGSASTSASTLTVPHAIGDTIAHLPQKPFKAGKRFVGWFELHADGTLGEEVLPETPVYSDMTVVAQFSDINVYTVVIEYYYEAPASGQEYIYESKIFDVEPSYLPKTVLSPANISVGESVDASHPVYFASKLAVEITPDMLPASTEETLTLRVKYVPFNAEYDYVYYLRDVDGVGYTEIPGTREHVEGVLGTNAVAQVKEFSYATFASAPHVRITENNMEVPVYYERKTFTLNYIPTGGSSVNGATGKYGTEIPLTTTIPTRVGYTFEGWYLDEALTQPAGTTITLTGNVTLYAKWKGKVVNYTIEYLREVYDNTTHTTKFVYEGSGTGQALAGTVVTGADAPSLGAMNGWEYDTEFNAAQQVIVQADGSSVLQVRYKLIRYTIKFDLNRSTGAINIGGRTYYDSTNPADWYTISDVVIGQDISSMWPAGTQEVYDTTGSRNFYAWEGAPSTYLTKRYELIYSDVRNADRNHVMTFTGTWNTNDYRSSAYYWLQQTDGTYAIEESFSQYDLNTTNLGAKEIHGYTLHDGDGSAPSGYAGSGQVISSVRQDSKGSYVQDDKKIGGASKTYYEFEGHLYRQRSGNGDSGLTRYSVSFARVYNFYYDLTSYTISYFDNGMLLAATAPIYFGDNINIFVFNFEPEKPEGKEDYIWGGWYEDANLTTPFVWSTMPEHDVAVYARWIAPTYTVTFDSQGAENTYESQTRVKGAMFTYPGTPTKPYHKFEGWYTDPVEGTLYGWAKAAEKDITLYARWTQAPITYTVHYYEEGTTNRLHADKVVVSPAIKAGQTITEEALLVAGFWVDSATKSAVMDYENNEITFYYKQRAGVTGYTVHYVIKDTNTPVAAPLVVNDVSSSQSSVICSAAKVDYAYMAANGATEAELLQEYYPTAAAQELVLGSDGTSNMLYFEYLPYDTAHIQVTQVDMDGEQIPGTTIFETDQKVGEIARLTLETPQGFSLAPLEEKKLTMRVTQAGTIEVVVRYQKDVTIKAKSMTKSFDGNPLFSEGVADIYAVSGLVGEDEVSAVQFKGRQIIAGSSHTVPIEAVISNGLSDHSYYYNMTFVEGVLRVLPRPVLVTISAERVADSTYDGTAQTFGFTDRATQLVMDNAWFENKFAAEIWTALTTLNQECVNAGTYTISVPDIYNAIAECSFWDTKNFEITVNANAGELVISRAPLVIKTASAQKTYDGQALVAAGATMEGLVDADKNLVSVVATGSQTDAGTSPNSYQVSWNGVRPQNYATTEELGELLVEKATVTLEVTGNSAKKAYTGTEQSVEGYTVAIPAALADELAADKVTYGGSAEATRTEVGTTAMGLDAALFTYGEEVQNYKVAFEVVKDGQLTISAADMVVTITGKTGAKEYNGTEQTIEGYEVSIPAGADFTAADVRFSGVATAAGEDVGTYAMGLTENQFSVASTNYAVSFMVVDGKLEITPRAITIAGESKEFTFDGDTHTAEGVSVTEGSLVTGDSLVATAAGEITYVEENREGNNPVAAGYKIMRGTKDVTGNYRVTTEAGTLTMKAATLTVAGLVDVVYNGEEQELVPQISGAEGDVLQEGLDYTVTYSEDTVNAGTVTVTVTGSGNYTGTTEVTYQITPRPVTFVSGSATKEYDTTELVYHTVVVEGLVEGDRVRIVYTGSQTEPGESDNSFTLVWATPQAPGTLPQKKPALNAGEAVGETVVPTALESNYAVTVRYGALNVYAEAEFTVAKKVISAPRNGEFYTQGETVKFQVVITNTGSADLEGFTVENPLANLEAPKRLNYGESTTLEYDYVVTAADVAAGTLKGDVKVTAQAATRGIEDPADQAASASVATGKVTLPGTGDGAMGSMWLLIGGGAVALALLVLAFVMMRKRKK